MNYLFSTKNNNKIHYWETSHSNVTTAIKRDKKTWDKHVNGNTIMNQENPNKWVITSSDDDGKRRFIYLTRNKQTDDFEIKGNSFFGDTLQDATTLHRMVKLIRHHFKAADALKTNHVFPLTLSLPQYQIIPMKLTPFSISNTQKKMISTNTMTTCWSQDQLEDQIKGDGKDEFSEDIPHTFNASLNGRRYVVTFDDLARTFKQRKKIEGLLKTVRPKQVKDPWACSRMDNNNTTTPAYCYFMHERADGNLKDPTRFTNTDLLHKKVDDLIGRVHALNCCLGQMITSSDILYMGDPSNEEYTLFIGDISKVSVYDTDGQLVMNDSLDKDADNNLPIQMQHDSVALEKLKAELGKNKK